MQWTLLRFDEPILITSDQPVVRSPMPPGGSSPVTAIPPSGFYQVIEIRFPLSPRLALLTSWRDAPHGDVVDGTWQQAVNMNAVVRAQADWHWIRTMERAPALPPVILREPMTDIEPIAAQILPGTARSRRWPPHAAARR